jgi:hypothetical protein
MSSDGFVIDSGRVLFRQAGREFSPYTLGGVVTIATNENGSGCRLGLKSGSSISIQWGKQNYCSNRGSGEVTPHSVDAEVAVIHANGEWHNFGSDTVAGWQSVDDVVGLINKFGGGQSAAW